MTSMGASYVCVSCLYNSKKHLLSTHPTMHYQHHTSGLATSVRSLPVHCIIPVHTPWFTFTAVLVCVGMCVHVCVI